MRIFLAFFLIFCFEAVQCSTKDAFMEALLSLNFNESEKVARQLDEGEDLPLFHFLNQLIANSGQFPENDFQILSTVNTSVDDRELLKNLLLGSYHLYNNPSNEESLSYLSNALLIAKREYNKPFEKLAYLLMLELYEEEIVQSSEDYLKYLEEYRKLVDTNYEMAWYHIHKLRYITKSVNVDEAAILFDEAFEKIKLHFTTYHLSNELNSYYHFISGVYHRFHKNDIQARSHYLKAIDLASDHSFLKYIRFSSYLHLCSIESSNGNFDISKRYLNLAKNNWNVSDSIRSKFIHDRFSAIYYFSKIGNYDSAYSLILSSIVSGENLDYRKNTLKISELNVKLKTAEKENEILLQKNQLDAQTKLLWIVATFSLILIGLAISLILSFRKIRTKNKKIETLMRELHHRVKNNLQVISSLLGLQSMKLKDETARKAVTEGKDRLRAMSLIHQKLYQNEDAISLNIKEYISNLVLELAQSYGYQNKTTFSIDVPSIEMDADNSLPLGLIVNELASNTFKYAFGNVEKPTLEIKLLKESDKEFSFLYRDNGPGLPKDFDFENTSSFGTKLISILVKQLNGSLNINQENGLTYRINFRFK